MIGLRNFSSWSTWTIFCVLDPDVGIREENADCAPVAETPR